MEEQKKVSDPRDLRILHQRLHELRIPHVCAQYEKVEPKQHQVINWAEYTGLQSVLNAALGEYQSKGFRLMMLSRLFIVLYFCDDFVCTFTHQEATIPAIRSVCEEYLGANNG